jgi:hypothetical protein
LRPRAGCLRAWADRLRAADCRAGQRGFLVNLAENDSLHHPKTIEKRLFDYSITSRSAQHTR